ncbi:MAG: GxxExxY protein [Anaerolineae bacterium]|jgi:GxxExxY protein
MTANHAQDTDEHRYTQNDGQDAQTTGKIIKAFYSVYNALGYGFLERVYENAMAIEVRRLGMHVVTQAPINVYYGRDLVGQYFADLLVEQRVLVELKAVRTMLPEHEAQLLNYLKATPCEVGLVLNFGPRPQIKRKVYGNTRKGTLAWIQAES